MFVPVSPGHSVTYSVTAERLRRSEIFGNLADADLVAMAEFCREETHQEGEVVLAEGAPAEALFVVERGKLALEKKIQIGRHSTPRNATIGYVEPGKLAGFSTLTMPDEYSTSAMCLEPTRVIRIDGPAVREYLEAHPAAGWKVITSVA